MSTDRAIVIAPFGLTTVYTHDTPEVDIVFVHGLNGNPRNTWTAENGLFWPQDLLPKYVEKSRIMTYGYDANVTAFTDGVSKNQIHHHSENLVARLAADRSDQARERPIIFVVHSLGGLVTKQALIYSRNLEHGNQEHLRSIFISTYGILFLGTPHTGSDKAKWGVLAQSIASAMLPRRYFDSSSTLVESLKKNNVTLQMINRGFNEIAAKFRIYYFYESKPMQMPGTRQFVVDEDSAAPETIGAERMGIERDHSTMCKFEDTAAPGFSVVADAVRRYAADAPYVIEVAWSEDKLVQRLRRDVALQAPSIIEQRRRSRDSSPGNTTPLIDVSNGSSRLLENIKPAYEIEELITPKLVHSIPQINTQPAYQEQHTSTPSVGLHSSTSSIPGAPLGFRPNTHFIGFKYEMTRLERKLADPARAALGTNTVLLHGPPGCGKSHLAREYLWRYKQQYSGGVFWVDCKTPETLSKGFWKIALCLDTASTDQLQDSFVDRVRDYLSKKSEWLVVFDGLSFKDESMLEAFKDYVPDTRGGSIIFTSVDSTLIGRQRLLNPIGIKIYPLLPDQGCMLVYKSLNYREGKKISERAQMKATQLVRHCGSLPLAIHATAHSLLASGRALENYRPGPADSRLSGPFMDIFNTLRTANQGEAINLLLLLSFLNHEVPVTLLNFGHAALVQTSVEIKGLNRNGSTTRELDNSIAVLIKYGLLERKLHTHSTSSNGRSSPEETRTRPPSATTQTGPSQEPDTESSKSSNSFVGIDTLMLHTVVQNIYLENLRSDSEQIYQEWLMIATKFVVGAWRVALARMKSKGGGYQSDYHELQSHVEKVWSLYPPRAEVLSSELIQAHHDLHETRDSIREELKNMSPRSSQSGKGIFTSIFERSGSSSDEGPDTPGSLTRTSTWSLDLDATFQSPVMYVPPPVELPTQLVTDDPGYLSDVDFTPRRPVRMAERVGASQLRGLFKNRREEDEESISHVARTSSSQTLPSTSAGLFARERPVLGELSWNRKVGEQSKTSPHLKQALLAQANRGQNGPPVREIQAAPLAVPIRIRPDLQISESRSMPSEFGTIPMLRDASHESAISAQTDSAVELEGVEHNTLQASPTVKTIGLGLSQTQPNSPWNTRSTEDIFREKGT